MSSGNRFIKELGALLQKDGYEIHASHSASDARRKLLESSYDFVAVNAPLCDESGARLCIDVSCDGGTIAAIFAAADCFDKLYENASAQGVFVLRKPSSRAMLSQAFSLMVCARERLRTLEKKVDKTESKLDEIRIVNKAKWLLIDHEGLTETEAHKQIEKTAMDAGVSNRLAAQIIIDNYH